MNLYYSDGTTQHGPYTVEEFREFVADGIIDAATLVMTPNTGGEWHPYGETLRTERAVASTNDAERECVECGNHFPLDDVLEYQGSYVCGGCKGIFFQRIKEGALQHGTFEYAGFAIRFLAKFIDQIILQAIYYGMLIGVGIFLDPESEEVAALFGIVIIISSIGIPVLYNTFFIGKMAATPGKLALGLKIIRPDGSRVSYLRAFGRYFAEMLSGMILLIGYIMAAFDDEKRTLHDRICDTRVIRVR